MQIWHNFIKTLAVIAIWLCIISQSASAQNTNDQKAGSVLFYNIYTSRTVNTAGVDTRLSITNTSPNTGINIHFYFVDAFTCHVADAVMFLTPSQTASFQASDMDPDVSGYIVAVAVDRDGLPTQHNFLIGSEAVKQTLGPTITSTHSYHLGAQAFVKVNNQVPALLPDGSSTTLVFDGGASASSYEQLPSEVTLDNFESQLTADTRLILYSPSSSFYGPGSFGGQLFIVYYDDMERPFSAAIGLVCWLQTRLNIIRNLSLHVGVGQSGWGAHRGLPQ